MASLDYGVISIKNGKLVSEGTFVHQGEGGYFIHELTGMVIYRMSVKDNPDVDQADFVQYFNQEIDLKGKIVLNWKFKNLNIKSKKISSQMYLTFFKDEIGDSYQIIHGNDVSLNDFWFPQTKKIISNKLKKLLKQ